MIKKRRLPLAFNATIVRPESPAEITARPRVRYKIEQLILVVSKPWTIGVHDLLVNGVSQMGAKKDTPAENYAAVETEPTDAIDWAPDDGTVKNRVSCKEALAGQPITLQLFNRSKEPVTVSIGAMGVATYESKEPEAQAPAVEVTVAVPVVPPST